MISIKDLANILLNKHQVKHTEAEIFIQQMVEVINDGLARDRQVKIKGFGTFKLQTVKERVSVNVNTGERVVISEHDKVTFTPDNVMKDIINKPFSQFETVIVAEDSPLLDESFEVSMDEEDEEEPMVLPVGQAAEPEQKAEEVLPAGQEVEPEQKAEEVLPAGQEAEPEQKVEPDIEETPEPVIEEAPKVEPVVEETPEPVVEKVPEPIEEKTSAPEPIEEKVPEPVEEKQEEVTEENGDEEDVDAECNKQYPHCRNIFVYYGILINIIVALIAFAAGYFACQNHWLTDEEPAASVSNVATKVDTTAQKVEAPVQKVERKSVDSAKITPKDSVATKKQDTQQAQPKETKELPEAKQKEQPAKTAQTEETPLRGYDSDARVRTGAYYIMGTDKEVTMKEGQTLKSISRTYLGPDMECYVEVYNRKDLKPGDKVKIPKLKLKKLLKKK